ncbi:hypothetical protein HMPREF3038_00801 [Akkermansia sp. KLE1797]|nr:hypothetical protein HMPREF3038_00801 [Akkermansia sp. KLE1797]KXU54544.1 hypothetical protein HMPREF3039_01441 [Akkermansia sp. KLE1798]
MKAFIFSDAFLRVHAEERSKSGKNTLHAPAPPSRKGYDMRLHHAGFWI